jgi:hypothetical protein
LLLEILLPVALVAVVGIVFFRRSALHGSLMLSTASNLSVPFPLTDRPWFTRPWFTIRLDNSISRSGVIRVSGNPFNRAMSLKLRNSTLPDGDNTLFPGGQTMISGLTITHAHKVPEPPSYTAEQPGFAPDPSEPAEQPDLVSEPPEPAEQPDLASEPPEPSGHMPRPDPDWV